MTLNLKFYYHWLRLMTSRSLFSELFLIRSQARRNRNNPILWRHRMRSELTSIGKDAYYHSGTLVLAMTLSQGMQLQNTLDGKLIFSSLPLEKTLRQRTVGIHYPWCCWKLSPALLASELTCWRWRLSLALPISQRTCWKLFLALPAPKGTCWRPSPVPGSKADMSEAAPGPPGFKGNICICICICI